MESTASRKSPAGSGALSLSAAILAVPTLVLLTAAVHLQSLTVAAGGLAVALGGILVLLGFGTAIHPPASASTILLYLMALGWLWFPTREHPDVFARISRGLLLLGAVGLFIRHDLARSGVEPRRRARVLCKWLRCRTRWPQDLSDFERLPEIRALQEIVDDDPMPVIALLSDPRPEVQLAALLSLQRRPYWREFEAVPVLALVRQAREPMICAAALRALKTVEDSTSLNEIAGYLRHAQPEVRQAALDAILYNCNRRWPAVRNAVKEALSDPALAEDGALPAGKLSPLAICDLTSWATEAPPLGDRSIQSLIAYYALALSRADQTHLAAQLAEQAIDANTPPILRVELAHLLREFRLMTPELLDRMSDLDQPGPLRLVAAEALLELDPNDPTAIEVLRGLGRQPNRETALTIAWLLQRYLGLDMGLPADGTVLPNSKPAIEAAKRVLQWANSRPGETPMAQHRPQPMPRPLSSPTLSGLKGTQLRTYPQEHGDSGSIWSSNR